MNESFYSLLVNWLQEPVLQGLTNNYIPERSQVSSNALLKSPLAYILDTSDARMSPMEVARDSWCVRAASAHTCFVSIQPELEYEAPTLMRGTHRAGGGRTFLWCYIH